MSDRSEIMRAVKSQDTCLEMQIRRLIYSYGYRYRLHSKDLPGQPDIVFRSKKKVIFINGCFWHGHSCKRGARTPKSNTEYWTSKIGKNRTRDSRNQKLLYDMGWEVLVVWECETKDGVALMSKIRQFLDHLPSTG